MNLLNLNKGRKFLKIIKREAKGDCFMACNIGLGVREAQFEGPGYHQRIVRINCTHHLPELN